MFHGLLVGSSPTGQLLDDIQIRVAPQLGDFFAEQHQTQQTAAWFRQHLIEAENVYVSCKDMSDDASAARELVTAFGRLVSSSENRSQVRKEMYVGVSYGVRAADACVVCSASSKCLCMNTGYCLELLYDVPHSHYYIVIEVSTIAMTVGRKLSEELAQLVRDRGGTDYCLSFDDFPFIAAASRKGEYAIDKFRAEHPSVLPKSLMLLLKEERQRRMNGNARIHASYMSNADICELMQHTLQLDPTKPFSANPGALEILLDSQEQKDLFTTKCIEHNAFLSVVGGNLQHSSRIPITLTTHDRKGDGVPHEAHFQTNIEPIIESVAKLHLVKTICNMLHQVCKSARKLGSCEVKKDGQVQMNFDGYAGPWLSQDVCRHVLALELKSCTSIVREQARLAMDHVPIGLDVIIID
jgi:hypothetical protein